MEIINSQSLTETQIVQLAELLKMKDSLDKINLSLGGGHPPLLDKRIIPVFDDAKEEHSPESKKRLMLQRVAQLSEADVPKSVVGDSGVTKLRPSSQDRFKLLKRDKVEQKERINNFSHNFLQKALVKKRPNTNHPSNQAHYEHVISEEDLTDEEGENIQIRKVKLRNFKESHVRMPPDLNKLIQTLPVKEG